MKVQSLLQDCSISKAFRAVILKHFSAPLQSEFFWLYNKNLVYTYTNGTDAQQQYQSHHSNLTRKMDTDPPLLRAVPGDPAAPGLGVLPVPASQWEQLLGQLTD